MANEGLQPKPASVEDLIDALIGARETANTLFVSHRYHREQYLDALCADDLSAAFKARQAMDRAAEEVLGAHRLERDLTARLLELKAEVPAIDLATLQRYVEAPEAMLLPFPLIEGNR